MDRSAPLTLLLGWALREAEVRRSWKAQGGGGGGGGSGGGRASLQTGMQV